MGKEDATALFEKLLARYKATRSDFKLALLVRFQNEVLFLLDEPVILLLEDSIDSLSPGMNFDWLIGKRVCITDPARGLFAIEWDEFLGEFRDADEVFERATPLKRFGDLNIRTIEHLHRQLVEGDFVPLKDVVAVQISEALGRIGTL